MRRGWFRATALLPCALAALLAGGCAGSAPSTPPAGGDFVPEGAAGPVGVVGRVVRVYEASAYVIVRAPRLPLAGEEARVFRGDAQVGTVRFDGYRQSSFGTADIVSGGARVGDRVVR